MAAASLQSSLFVKYLPSEKCTIDMFLQEWTAIHEIIQDPQIGAQKTARNGLLVHFFEDLRNTYGEVPQVKKEHIKEAHSN